jgi:hypothetical protein
VSNIDRMAKLQSAINSKLKHPYWPKNLSVGVTVESYSDMKRLAVLGQYRVENKWAAFLPFRSYSDFPLYSQYPELGKRLKEFGIKWVVFGSENGQNGNQMSLGEVKYLAKECEAAGQKLFYASPSSTLAFQRGDDLMLLKNENHEDESAHAAKMKIFESYKELPEFRSLPVADVSGFVRAFDSTVQIYDPHSDAA